MRPFSQWDPSWPCSPLITSPDTKRSQSQLKTHKKEKKKGQVKLVKWRIIYLSFQRRHIRSLGTFKRLEMVFLSESILSDLLTLISNWPPVVGATVTLMCGSPEEEEEEEAPPTRWPHKQVGVPPALTASLLSTTWLLLVTEDEDAEESKDVDAAAAAAAAEALASSLGSILSNLSLFLSFVYLRKKPFFAGNSLTDCRQTT